MSIAGEDLRLFDADPYRDAARLLRERFIVPPFTVLDSSQGYWRARKRNWISLGIESELGREQDGKGGAFKLGAVDTEIAEQIRGAGLVSIYDPVLCELVYRWWSPADGVVLDPFAGGSVRGVVAAMMGRSYRGTELRGIQVEANRVQSHRLDGLYPGLPPVWGEGDSLTMLPDVQADLVFTCPPYGDLEIYSDDPRDISNMSSAGFRSAYEGIIEQAAQRLRADRYCVITVGNYRNDRGILVDLVGLTVDACRRVGLGYYSDTILVTPVGTAAARASALFAPGRKPTPRHQHILVFVKGDWRRASDACEPLPDRGV